MAETTKIEWADSTLNVWFGCTKVSPACDHCYAENWAKRSGLAEWGPHAERVQAKHWREQLAAISRKALKAGRPWFVFVNSLSDFFDKQADPTWRWAAVAEFRKYPHLTFILLTKRIGNAEEMIAGAGGLPPNCALMITVIDQPEADRDIPKLLALKAALGPAFVGVSMEPLQGPVDLTEWIPPRSPWPAAEVPRTWAEFVWPDWVKPLYRAQIESFWAEKYGRGPRAWIADMSRQGAPPTGGVADLYEVRSGSPVVRGRYLHAWNNIGRVLLDDGSWKACSFGRSHGRPALDWIIVGGESGAGARPMHPDWARDLRDQCAEAGAAFLFKQWGEWTPGENAGPITGPQECAWWFDDQWDTARHGKASLESFTAEDEPDLFRVGKKAAGRLLDGVAHDARPEVRS